MRHKWWTEGNEAWFSDSSGSIWHGPIAGRRVIAVAALNGTTDCLAVLDWMGRPVGVKEWHPYANLLRVGPGGVVRWQILPPAQETLGSWVGLTVKDGEVIARSWSFACRIEPFSGAILSAEFTR